MEGGITCRLFQRPSEQEQMLLLPSRSGRMLEERGAPSSWTLSDPSYVFFTQYRCCSVSLDGLGVASVHGMR